VLHSDLLLALAAMPVQGIEQHGIQITRGITNNRQ